MLLISCLLFSCTNAQKGDTAKDALNNKIIVGAERTKEYFPLLNEKKIGVVANQTSLIENTHLVDSLFNAGFNIVKAFGPEHGFRGKAADGEHVENAIDRKTGIQIVSLYGANRKPSPKSLEGIDLMIFDIQDVGARFYTYISTMSYVMEACAENDIEFLVLDRPNPHGDYVDGPVLEKEFSSFVGLHPVPVVHGMTIGEYAQMVNGEGWLKDEIKCDLTVVECENYDHNTHYQLPAPPSPNLPNNTAIQLYPSLCFFEGTIISVGRGTVFPFQVIGHPDYMIGSFVFTPEEIPGVAKNPKYEGQVCYGQSLKGYADSILAKERRLHLSWLINFYEFFKDRDDFFIPYFSKLAGTENLKNQIIEGKSEEDIRESWEDDLNKFRQIRKKYLIYTDFE
ncbi:MAG: DUF1343 domain-containing protein [Bacteroidales bacterium]|nr:DUF1343 domain-containing protein [Bacteroidales bacterium]